MPKSGSATSQSGCTTRSHNADATKRTFIHRTREKKIVETGGKYTRERKKKIIIIKLNRRKSVSYKKKSTKSRKFKSDYGDMTVN